MPTLVSRRFAAAIAAIAAITVCGAVSSADPKREVPDYDGRGNPEAEAGSWLLWFPRALLAPVYVVNEYALRRPLGALIGHAERDRWTDSFAHLFTFGEAGHSKLVPIASFDLGVLPSAGVAYTRDALLAPDNALELAFATWGPRRIDASAADRYAIDRADRVALGLGFERAADRLFVGLGPDAADALRARYGVERFTASAGYRRRLSDAARLDVESGVRHVGFITGECCGDPSLDTRIARGEAMAPPGYRDDYTAGFGRAELTIDTSGAADAPGTTGYLTVRGAPSLASGRSWIGYGGALGGAIDLTGHHRIVSAQVAVDLVDRLSGDPVPFTEYAMLGGDAMPGFVAGWLTGRSAAAAQLAYTWPLWLGLNAQTRVAVGNAFDAHLAGASAAKLRLSGDLALMSSTQRDRGFEVVVGLGTETFEQGAAITSLRVMLGSKRGL